MGALLSLDVAAILDGPAAQRMNRFWRLMPSALRGIPKNIIFRVGPRLAETGLRWAPATMLLRNYRNGLLQASEKTDDQGLLTAKRGLLVQFTGFRVYLPQRPGGLRRTVPSILGATDSNVLWVKGDDGNWGYLRRAFCKEEDDYLTNKTLLATIAEGCDMWIICSHFDILSSMKIQSSICLLTEVQDNDDGVKQAHSKLLVTLAHATSATQNWLNGIARLSQLLAQSSAAQHLSSLEQSKVNVDSESYRSARDKFESDVSQIADSDDAKNIAADANHIEGHDGSTLIKGFMERMFWGDYLCMADLTPSSQQWCVD